MNSNVRPRRLLLLVLVAVVLALPVQAGDDNRAVQWSSYREALAAAQREDKPIMIHFTGSYSPLCAKMRRTTYGDKHVIRFMNAEFATTMVNVAQVPSLARKYKVKETPVLWFLDATGKPLTSIKGEVGPKKLLRVGQYITEKIYEHTDYETWLDRRSGR